LAAVLGCAGVALASALVVAVIVALGKSKLWMSFVPDNVVVADTDLSAQELAFLDGRGRELAALGFRPMLTYRLTNSPRPSLFRIWLDPTGNHRLHRA
jgi:hypothetical protein